MMKTEHNLRYRPRSLSFCYDTDRCQHPNLRPLGLHEVEQVLRQNAPLLEQDEIEYGQLLDIKPKLPYTESDEEERKFQMLKNLTCRYYKRYYVTLSANFILAICN